MESKQKSLKYVQKARKELMLQEEKVKILQEELANLQHILKEKENALSDKDLVIERLRERVRSLEDTLALFYNAIEKDEERVSKEHKPIESSLVGQEKKINKYPLPAEPDRRKQIFEEEMNTWRAKETKRKRGAPIYTAVFPTPSNEPMHGAQTHQRTSQPAEKQKEQLKQMVKEPVSDRPMKMQKVVATANIHQDSLTTSSPILNRKPSSRTNIVTEDSSHMVLTMTPLATSSPAKAVSKQAGNSTTPLQRRATDSPSRQPLAPLQRNMANKTNVELTKGTPPALKKATPQATSNKGLGLFAWCKQSAAPHQVKDFTKSWSDGVALCTLLNNVRPGCIQLDSLDPNDSLHNIALALDTAEKVGISPCSFTQYVTFVLF